MESSRQFYYFSKSFDRIESILDAPAGNFQEVRNIPSRASLTFENGFYVACTCIYLDIKNSSDLPNKYLRPRLGKIYRSLISECVAVFNASSLCAEVNIHGDAVWAVYEGNLMQNIDEAFSVCATLSSLIRMLNCSLQKRGIDPISVGIGADYGRALMIKAGYNGSGINDVVWMGEVVNQAAYLCKCAKQISIWDDARTCVSPNIYNNLNDHNRGLLQYSFYSGFAHGLIINPELEKWWVEKCQ